MRMVQEHQAEHESQWAAIYREEIETARCTVERLMRQIGQ